MTTLTALAHHALCTHHLGGDDLMDPADTGLCTHEVPGLADGNAIVSVVLSGTPDVEVYVSDKAMTATTARQLAYTIGRAAEIVDGLALPEGGQACHVEHVALLAGVSQYAVRDAITRGDLEAHKAVDGTPRLIIAWDEATRWAKAARAAAGE